MERPPQPVRKSRNATLQLCEKVACAEIAHSMNRVEAQSIKVIILQPIECVLDEEPPHVVAALTIEIDRLTPRSAVTIGKVRSEYIKVVAFRAEMVVDHVECNSETVRVGRIHESMKPGRTTV